jgi:hypothetical protein
MRAPRRLALARGWPARPMSAEVARFVSESFDSVDVVDDDDDAEFEYEEDVDDEDCEDVDDEDFD